VTGGASGIGSVCAGTLAREGTKVVVTELDDAGGQWVVDKIGSAGGSAVFFHQCESPLELRRYRPLAGHIRRAAKSMRGSISI
jgi:NAD(P)-dependent dehydrogenase (short-subunit alcohol dehydrogenase family)